MGKLTDLLRLAGKRGHDLGLSYAGALTPAEAWEVWQLAPGARLIDVRTRAEYATGFVPGSLNIPHTELRERLDEVRAAAADRPVRVMCQSGVRSAIAHRIVAQSGFDSASLSGGMLTLRAWLGERQSDVLERPEVLERA